MATAGNERELLTKGVEQDGVVRGVWAQNLWRADDAISVRPGWGVLAELDTTLGNNIIYKDSVASDFLPVAYGYTKHLGSCFVKTNFGNEQVLSVFLLEASPNDVGADNRIQNRDRYYGVRIYDITTDRVWEEVLHNTTSMRAPDDSVILEPNFNNNYPSEWYGCYETSFDRDNSSFIKADKKSKWFFSASRDFIYFGSTETGLFYYNPADFGAQRYMQLQRSSLFDFATGHSETSLISKIHFVPGVYEEGFVYAKDSQISKIVAAVSFRGRIAYATDYEVWFSDVNSPNTVIAQNFIEIPSNQAVTALYEFRGNLIIFTRNEMFLYVPSEGNVISQGRPPIKVSESVGCIGQQAITMLEDDLVWVSHTGVYVSSDGASLKEISDPIRGFWGGHGQMTNPMTSYYESNSGWVDIDTVDPPRTLISFDDDRVTLAYNHDKKALIMGVPSINGCWCFTGLWSWWPMESVANTSGIGIPIVSASRNLVEPYVLATTEDIFAVCGTVNNSIADNTHQVVGTSPNTIPSGAITAANSAPSNAYNYVACRLGLGGAIDRSTDNEDYRLGCGKYVPSVMPDAAYDNGCFFIDEPYEDISLEDPYYTIPFYLVAPVSSPKAPIYEWELLLKFDKTEWDFEPNALTSDIAFFMPAERARSVAGLTICKITDVAKNPTPTGDYLHIKFDGNAAPAASWNMQPYLNLAEKFKNPLINIMIKKKTVSSVAGFGFEPVEVRLLNGTAAINPSGLMVWTKQFIGPSDSHNNDAKAQPVDWAFKSNEVSESGIQLRARGIYARLSSRGRGTTKLVPLWVWGLYNVILGSDRKDYTSQIVDFDGDISKIESKGTIRSRFRNAALAMSTRVFSNIEIKWGSQGNSADGNYLIDDQQVDTIATSDSVKGERISYMVFGFIQNKAESLTLLNLRGVFRAGGGRRRTGR